MIHVKPIQILKSCFLKIIIGKNNLIGVIYRTQTAIDDFINDVDSILQTISRPNEKK